MIISNHIRMRCTLCGKEHKIKRRLFCYHAADQIFEVSQMWQQREELYKATISKYDKEERLKLAEMYGMLVMALEEGLGDTLGEIYMGSIGGDAGKGQFFTPYSLSLACASLTLPKENADGKVTVNEKDNAAFIQKNGKPIAVVISYERYERLLKSGIDINEF